MAMLGMDVEQVRTLARRLADGSAELEVLSGSLGAALQSTPWQGLDAESFRADWQSFHGPILAAAAELLQTAAERLQHELNQQVTASAFGIGGGTFGSPASGPGSASSSGGETGAGGGRPPTAAPGQAPPADEREGWHSDWWGLRGKAEAPKFEHDLNDGKDKISLGSLEGGAYVYRGEGTARGALGAVDLQGHAGAEVGVGGEAKGEVSLQGLDVEAGLRAGLRADAEGGADLGPAHLGAGGALAAGAIAQGRATLGRSGLRAEGEAFTGGKAEAKAGGDLGGIGGEARGEAWAGFGVAGGLDASYHDRKIHLSASAGAAYFLGGKVGASITIDPEKVVDTVQDLSDGIDDVGRAAWHGLFD